MDRSFSIYLELARIVATLIVFMAHGLIFYHPLAELNETAKFGRDGVIIFFVLSGFVITWCANEREKSVRTFIVNRASRIYSVALPGIVIGFIAGIAAAVHAHQDMPYQLHKLWLYLPLYVTFTGNFWHLSETPPGNFPYWSLNYEVWYYVIFGTFYFVRRWFRWPAVFGLLFLVGPQIIELLPLWLLGSGLYYARHGIKLRAPLARAGIILSCCLYFVIKLYAIDNRIDDYNSALWRFLFNASEGFPPQLLGDYALGLLVAINFICALNARITFTPDAEHLIKRSASYSFSFYLFHIPIFSILRLFLSENRIFMIYLMVLLFTSAIVIVLARFTEHKKSAYRALFQGLINKTQRALKARA